MSLQILREDALRSQGSGFCLRLSLPWIRSLPLASLTDLEITIDFHAAVDVRVVVGTRLVAPEDLTEESAWWFIQDRVAVVGDLNGGLIGSHRVRVAFTLMIPYLQAGPDGPLRLPFVVEQTVVADAPAPGGRCRAMSFEPSRRDLAADSTASDLPNGWTLTASAFNWTPEVIRAERSAPDIAVGIVTSGVAPVIEVELGQLWRSFPDPSAREAELFAEALADAGGAVSIVGVSLDDWASATRRRDDDERLAFLLPQLKASSVMGATGVRLPIGQAGGTLLQRLLPHLRELDLTLFEEIQGQQSPQNPDTARAIDVLAGADDERLRLLVDISMLMPALPDSYLDILAAAGVPDALVDRLRTGWLDPATIGAVVGLLRSGGVPPQVQTMYMNLLIRFGRSHADDLRAILPLIGAFHLKFWDLDDADHRISQPLRDLGALLADTGFSGTFTSEWGGHEWLDDDPTDITRRHLNLARVALAEGTTPAPRTH